MNIRIKTANDLTGLELPCREEKIAEFCKNLDIANNSKTEVTVDYVYLNDRANALLSGKTYNLDKLNYLAKRLDSFDKSELTTFYAVAYSEKTENIDRLINHTFNTHCYSVVSDFSDLEAIGKSMYLTQQGGVTMEELDRLDGESYFKKVLADNPNPAVTPYGILYRNKNEYEQVYDGMQYYVEDNHEAIIPKELFHQVQEEKLRRASLHKTAVTRKKNKEEKEKSKYSSKYILTDLMVCAECGHAYRRQIWSKYGDKTAVWRCEDRLKQGKKSRCQHSPTIKEAQLHDAIMTAINSVVENTGEFIGTFRENVIRIIGNYSTQGVTTEYDEQIEKLQQQILILIEDNAKQGTISEDFDEEYHQLSEQINELKTARIQVVQAQKKAESYKERVEQLDKAITTVNPQVREFDQDLVKRLISSIRVHKGMKLEIQFHSGIVVKQEVDYYE